MNVEMKKMGRSELADRLAEVMRERDRFEKQAEDKKALSDKLMQQLSESQQMLRESQTRLNDSQQALMAAREEISSCRAEQEASARQTDSLRAQLEEALALLTGEREKRRLAEQEQESLRVALSEREREISGLLTERDEARCERDSLSDALSRRDIAAGEAGSIAEAALKVSGVFERAQEAAQTYLLSIEKMASDQKKACEEMAERAGEEAGRLIAGAEARCEEMKRAAQAYCEEQKRLAEEDGIRKRHALSEQLGRIRSEIMNSISEQE